MNNPIRFISDIIFFIKFRKGDFVGSTVIYWIVGILIGVVVLLALSRAMTPNIT